MSAGGSPRGGDCGADPVAAPLSSRACDCAVALFAIWTIVCHATVALGGNLKQLLVAYGAALLAAGAAWLAARRRVERPREVDPIDSGPRAATPKETSPSKGLRLGGLLVAVVIATTIDPERHPIWLWWLAIAALSAAAVAFVVLAHPTDMRPARGPRLEWGLLGLALVCATLALVVHRPDIDDSFYVNVAVAVADDPALALLVGDTLLGVADLPLHMPAHRLHSWELWNGAISYLSGLPTLAVFHLGSAALVAALVPLAHARLFRLLAPQHWLWATTALLVVLIASGETHRSYGNFSFVRMWQGKGVYLFFFTPLIYAQALRFARRPGPASWLLLAGAQIGAVGCSSSAVWAAPVAALTALACALRPRRRDLAIFGVGAASCLYVLAVGFVLKGELEPLLATSIVQYAFGAQLESALSHVFGHERLLGFGLVAILGAWTVAVGYGRRFAIVFPLAIFAVLLNPYWDHWVAGNLTGPSFWRVMWSLPVPILMALLLTAPVQLAPRRWPKGIGPTLGAAALVAFAACVPSFSTLSERNGGAGGVGIRIGAPGLKVPEVPHRWAAQLTARVEPGAVVLAVPEVSVWIATFRDRAHPLQARRLYLERHWRNGRLEDAELRAELTRYVGGENAWADPDSVFRDGLERFDIAAVCLRESDWSERQREVLLALGFRRDLAGDDLEIWLREPR